MKQEPLHRPGRAAGTVVVTDGAAGNERQALSLALGLRVSPRMLRIALRAPWRWIGPGFVRGASLSILRWQWKTLSSPWPALAIGCGRHAAVIVRALREASGGATFAVQILDPRIDPAHFDVVVAPRHDGLDGDNVVQTMGSLNPVDDAWLADAKVEFSTLQQLPRPRTALLVGGLRHGLDMDEAWLAALIARLERWRERDGGSMLITTSRRTPPQWRERLRAAFKNGTTCFWGGEADGANPYPGYLAVADRIVVTPDSVNMLSEACATGAPVFTSLPANPPAKLAAFHAELVDQGWLHDIGAEPADVRQPPPLRELATVASKIRHRIEATRPDIAVALDR
ncbi:MAG: mitochondrial fission ELM1 family protein [Rudaea sp.]|uniref:mitochondrial fission ELM1 family protein n=1 Tax=Rudaea sp. TaxID=2136325 RepID=UPI0039E4322C